MHLPRSILSRGRSCILAVACLTAFSPLVAGDTDLPQPLNEQEFAGMMSASPFTRTLGVSDSLILTGVANLQDDVVATLFDTQAQVSHLVSRKPNPQGWQLVGITGSPSELRTWAAKIQVAGGEVISVRYQKPPLKKSGTVGGGSSGASGSSSGSLPPISSAQIAEAKNAAVNYKEGFSSDGYPRQPPPEMVAKLSRLSASQREDINKQMLGWRNKGLGLDERRKIYENLVERNLQGRR